MRCSIRADVVGAWMLAAWAGLAGAQAPSPSPSAAAAKAPARQPARAADPHRAPPHAGYTVAATPAWVHPLAADLATPVASSPFQILLVDGQTRVAAGSEEAYLHVVRRVNAASALQAAGQVNLVFDPVYQKLAFHRIEIVRGAQRIDKLDTSKINVLHRETQLERQMVDGRLTATLVLDDLRPGDLVEFSATISGANPVFGGRFVDSTWSQSVEGPIHQLQYRLLAPASREIHVQANDPAAVEITSSVQGGERETLVRRHDAPQLALDLHTTPGEYLKAVVDFSEFADWAEVDDWAQRLFAPAMQPSPALDAQVAALKAQAATPADLLRATLDFVQKDVRYFGTEDGIGSHKPAPVDTVLSQRFGDCKDKAALLSALLEREGLSAAPVLASLQYREATEGRLASPLAFDHVIVRATVDGVPLYLDATRSDQTGAVAARQATGLGSGLEVRAGSGALTALPGDKDVVVAETVDTFTFPRLAQEGTLDSVTTYHGEWAEGLRKIVASRPASELESLFTAEVLRDYPSLALVGHPEFDAAREDDSFQVTVHFRTGDFWTFPEQRALVGRYALWGIVQPLRLPDEAPRTRPLRLNPGRYLHKAVFAFGESDASRADTRRYDERDRHFDVHVKFDAQPARMELAGELHVTEPAVKPEEWAAYRDELSKVMTHLAGTVQVPAMGSEQRASLRKAGDQLLDDVRHGRVDAPTRVQGEARFRLVVLDAELQADRLQPKLRAQALVARGVNLDHIGKTAEGRDAFQQAISLDPASAEAHEALATNAFLRRADAEALHEVDETLRLAPETTGVRYDRVWTNYFGDKLPEARDELKSLLQVPAEVDRGYGALWMYLATRRLGGDGADAVKTYEPGTSTPAWPHAILEYLRGQMDMDALLKASQEAGNPSREHECELYFFAGEKALADGDLDHARTYLGKSVATGAVEEIEYDMARREQERLAKR